MYLPYHPRKFEDCNKDKGKIDFTFEIIRVFYQNGLCCEDRNTNFNIQILDHSGNVVATQTIAAGDVSNTVQLRLSTLAIRVAGMSAYRRNHPIH